MNELVRMQYLDAMGIDSFVPRMVLPAAQPSVACELPVSFADVEPAAQFTDPFAGEESSSPAVPSPESAAIVQQLLSPEGESQKPATTESKAPVPVGITLQALLAAKPKKQLRFALTIWQLENGVVFIDSKEPKAALPTSALLGNIVKALYPTENLPKPDSIHWPLLESAVAPDNALAEAREMVHAFLASRFDVKTPSLLVVLGQMAKDVVIASAEDAVAAMSVGENASPAHLPCVAVYLPNLAELLRDPALKHSIWPAVKAAHNIR